MTNEEALKLFYKYATDCDNALTYSEADEAYTILNDALKKQIELVPQGGKTTVFPKFTGENVIKSNANLEVKK